MVLFVFCYVLVKKKLLKMSQKNENTIKRIPNFTVQEKEILIRIIYEKYSKILEDKQTNRVSLEENGQIWKKIEADFNNVAPTVCFRNLDQLKRLYENKKKELRKKIAEHKKQQYLTGGGPPPPPLQLDTTEEILILIINEKTVSGFHSDFDSDVFTEESTNKRKKIDHDDEEQIYEFRPNELSNDALFYDIETENKTIPDSELRLTSNSELDKTEKRTSLPENAVVTKKFPAYDFIKPLSEKLSVKTSESIAKQDPGQDRIKNKISPEPTDGTKSEVKPKYDHKRASKLRADRRRPMKQVRALSSSDIGEKYNILLDKRLVLIEKQIEDAVQSQNFSKEKQKQEMKNLKQQEENLCLEKEEKILRVEQLRLEIKYKKSLLSSNV